MKTLRFFIGTMLIVCIPFTANAQFMMFGGGNRANQDSLRKIAAADYADMLAKVGVGKPREGRQPNSQDESKHPNYDELTANPYPIYPDPLVTESGKKVTSAKMWYKVRRPEIARLFEDNVYGHIPNNVPSVKWEVTNEEKKDFAGMPVVVRYLKGVVDNSSYPSIKVEIQANVVYPDNGKQNLPVIIEFGGGGGDPLRSFGGSVSWKQMVIERGWAAATINPSSIQADSGSGLTNGIIGLCNKGEHRQPTDWGSLRAWGWGLSRLIDYFETDKTFDATKCAIEGVSRYGKASLVAMAFEERIAAGFIASSGKAGAAGWRRDCGESIGNIVSHEEYHWVCGNLIKYGTDPMTENDLPVDQHELIALCAPRACFISTGSWNGDKWQDVIGSFISASKASPVYELLGYKGIGTDLFPGMDNGLMEGRLTYRQHHGGHEAGPNWPFFLDFFEREVVKYHIPVSEQHERMQTGQYEPTWQSLKTHQTPEWFRDAKFGIWAHWGPQCVEGSGDWMARSLYIEGSDEYKFHVKNYGHPSEFGFKDILPLFKAEKWDPEALVEKYKRCGAQYFFVLGNHHDNYDLWDSQYQPWNSQNIGPKRDILDGWAKAAKKAGLPLGISFHADHAWTWYEPAQRYDMNGSKAGVYYDGKLTKADGKGKWWEGYDPQMLYQQDHPMSDRSWANNSIHRQWGWENGACLPSQEFVTNFYDRTLDAINRYQPDLIYFDVTVLPFYPISDCGLKIAAHFYNKNPRSVVFGKILDDEQRKALTWDVERGAPNEIIPEPWQTCNCIGGWHYNTSIYEKNEYKSAATVVKQLVDIVSKNGNLLLSIPLRADGTYDEKEAQILDDLEAWMSVNKESIFGTRPWVRFGEGPVAEKAIKLNAQGFNDGQYSNMDYRDIRFNQTKKHLYVTAMGWPEDGKLVIKSLAKGNKDFRKSISTVYLLGYGKVKAHQTAEGLCVALPQPCNQIAPVLKIAK